MPSEEIGIIFGISPASSARLRNLLGQFASLEGKLRIETEAQLRTFADALKDEIRKEFIARGHDRTGRDDDPSQWIPGYVHAVDTLEVNVDGLRAEITMKGGAVYVRYGSHGHVIRAVNGPYLTFHGSQGWARVQQVNHPGYVGDDFVSPAMERVDVFGFLDRIVSSAMVEHWGYAENAAGEQYLAGQQM